MKKEIRTDHAPKAIGPYSQAVRAGNTVYASGQLPVDPQTGKIVEGTVTEQTTKVLENVSAILKEAGMNSSNVVKTTVFLQDLNDFQAMNNVYAQFFNGEILPARSTVQAARLPLGVMVEIDFIAIDSK